MLGIRYAVITKINRNIYYDEILRKQEFVIGFGPNGDVKELLFCVPENYDDLDFRKSDEWLRVRLPVFDLGEILIVNKSGREIAGRGRKPGKWDVECEYFRTLRGAIKCVRKLEELCKNK